MGPVKKNENVAGRIKEPLIRRMTVASAGRGKSAGINSADS